MRRKLIRQVKALVVDIRILFKFFQDKKYLRLSAGEYWHYWAIHKLTTLHLGRFPNLVTPRDYNDKIQWIKLFDQNPLMIDCADKLLVKEYAEKVLGEDICPRTYTSGSCFDELNIDSLPERFVIKTNHDTGTVFCVRDINDFDLEKVKIKVEASLGRVFGGKQGEWSYQHIKPKVFVEEFIGDHSADSLPADYKFHCSNGKVMWLQYIYDRNTDVKETIVMPNGHVTDIHFDHTMKPVNGFSKPEKWSDMLAIAEKLSSPFKYARIDLYLEEGRIFLGEVTFFPKAGCYLGDGQKVLGELIEL